MIRHLVASLCVASVALMVLPLSAAEKPAKKADTSLLTVDRIFDSGEFRSGSFAGRWLPDSSGFVRTASSQVVSSGKDIVRVDLETGEEEILVPALRLVPPGQSSPLNLDKFVFSDDRSFLLIYTNSKRVWRQNTRGDYWVLDRASHELRQLGGDAKPSTLMFAKFSPTGRHVAYVRENNIYVEDLISHKITPVTNDGSRTIINGTFDWVYEEELGLRDGFRFSPDGKSIAYWQLDTVGVREFTMINNTDEMYPRLIQFAYPKVGQDNSACRVGVVSIDGGKTRWLDVPGDPRNNYIARLEWTADSNILLQQLNRRQNTNRTMLADAVTGQVRPVTVDKDDAWVEENDELFWFADNRRFTMASDRDGWRHVYIASLDGEEPKLATPGEFDVIKLLRLDEESDRLYFIASPGNATQRYLYTIGVDGSGLKRLSPANQPGTHDYTISPDGQWAVHTYSNINTPPVTDLVRLPSHEQERVLVDNKKLKEKLAELQSQPTELLRIPIDDGSGGTVELHAYMVKPPKFNKNKKYPLIVYVYGEPAGQTVRDTFGGSSHLWHMMLAQRGYFVMSVDNRGTKSPRGREFRKFIYKKIGVMPPKDQAAALRQVLEDRPYLDADRIGVWGWSGGGSMSLNAIFKYPDLYKTAIAIASVPNQRYYDTIYQERYMGLPGDNVDGFWQGSPINFAHQLQGNLLIVHGTGDDNCHYATAEKLINELIRHNKQFSMMAYPNRSHSIREGKNTTRHLRTLMTNYFEANLPAGARER